MATEHFSPGFICFLDLVHEKSDGCIRQLSLFLLNLGAEPLHAAWATFFSPGKLTRLNLSTYEKEVANLGE